MWQEEDWNNSPRRLSRQQSTIRRTQLQSSVKSSLAAVLRAVIQFKCVGLRLHCLTALSCRLRSHPHALVPARPGNYCCGGSSARRGKRKLPPPLRPRRVRNRGAGDGLGGVTTRQASRSARATGSSVRFRTAAAAQAATMTTCTLQLVTTRTCEVCTTSFCMPMFLTPATASWRGHPCTDAQAWFIGFPGAPPGATSIAPAVHKPRLFQLQHPSLPAGYSLQ